MKKRASYKDFLIFSLWFIAIFGVSYAIMYAFGLIPSELNESGQSSVLDKLRFDAINSVTPATPETSQEPGEEPVHITIPNTKVDILVQNPNTTNPTLLDEYLAKGTVRYPGSGLLGNGNVLIFGHSSNWAIVKNPAYKSLNGIETLKAGDEIFVDSAESRYVYKTRTVRMAPASEIRVDFGSKENLLTISTCNTFAAKEDRYVVEAVFDHKEIK
jgi:sortase (surface protein transpeptidase)